MKVFLDLLDNKIHEKGEGPLVEIPEEIPKVPEAFPKIVVRTAGAVGYEPMEKMLVMELAVKNAGGKHPYYRHERSRE